MRLAPLALILLAGIAPASPRDDGATERLLDGLARRLREAGDPSDARAAAARLAFDRAKILDFVKSEIAWEPYDGVLRDSSGTLLSRAGNSLDRALLLQSMLEASGEKTRLVKGDLAEADGKRLLESFRARDPKARFARTEKDPKELARDLGLDEASLDSLVRRRRQEDAAFVDEVVEAAKTESARLTPLAGALSGRSAAAPKDHVWVQVADKAGWADLDPAPVELAHQGAKPLAPQELAAQRRTVTIRLILNRKVADKIEPVPLLTVPSDLSSVSWRAVDFLILPTPGQLPPLSKLRELDAKAALEAFRQVKQYRPGLMIGAKSYGGLPFDLEGKTYEVDAGGRVGPAKMLSGGVNKAFGGAFGGLSGGGGEKAAPSSSLESLVLEVGVKEPGAAEQVHQRVLLGPAKGGIRPLPILRTSFLIDGAPLPPGEAGRREAGAIARNSGPLRKLIQGQLDGVHFNQHVDVPSLLLRYGDLRRRVISALAEGPLVQDRPGLVAETSQLYLEEEAGRFVTRRGIDILDNAGYFDASAGRTMTLGAADTALECLLVERRWPGAAGRSAWTLMERARLLGGKAETADKGGRREIRWSAEAAWVVDPASGSCVGRVPSGAGQGLIEAAWENASAVCTYSDVIGFAAAMGSAGGVTSKDVDDAAALFGKACGIVGGTWPRDMVNDKINEVTQGLWTGAISALAGM